MYPSAGASSISATPMARCNLFMALSRPRGAGVAMLDCKIQLCVLTPYLFLLPPFFRSQIVWVLDQPIGD